MITTTTAEGLEDVGRELLGTDEVGLEVMVFRDDEVGRELLGTKDDGKELLGIPEYGKLLLGVFDEGLVLLGVDEGELVFGLEEEGCKEGQVLMGIKLGTPDEGR